MISEVVTLRAPLISVFCRPATPVLRSCTMSESGHLHASWFDVERMITLQDRPSQEHSCNL